MKCFFTFFILLVICQLNAQITGITTTTFSTKADIGNALPQKVSQAPNGDLYFFTLNFGLTKYSANTISGINISYAWSYNYQVFAASTGLWVYQNGLGIVDFVTTSGAVSHSAAIASLIGTISVQNPINYIGSSNSEIWFASKKGIVKYNGTYSLITKANSSLISDTVNCIFEHGSTVYVGTDKGLTIYNNGNFTPPILFNGASTHSVSSVYSNGIRTIASRKLPNGKHELYDLIGNQLVKITTSDSLSYNLLPYSMSLINGDPLITNSTKAKLISSTSYTNYAGGEMNYVFKHPSQPNHFLGIGATGNNTSVYDVDVATYSNYGWSSNPHESAYLDTNFVKAKINTCGVKHWDQDAGINQYEVPKGSGKHAGFTSSMWIGGLDNSGQLHLAAQTYRQNGDDFWAGPLDTINATANPTTGSTYNRVYKVSCNQINQFVTNYNSANQAANNSSYFNSINQYPGNGVGGNFAKQLGTYKDWNNNGIYEPLLGEYPIIKGHQEVYSIYNDNYKPHTESAGSLPMGIEVHERSYAYHLPNLPDTMQVINYTTFYNFQVINRSNTNYNNVYMSIWADVDLGSYTDDYIGTDTTNQIGYFYNANSTDGVYGAKLPMVAYAMVKSNSSLNDGIDNNNNGIIDEPNEQFKMSRTTFYNNNVGNFSPKTTNPDDKWDYYNYMAGRWKDSSYFIPFGNAYNPTLNIAPTKYVFTGNPFTSTGWTELSANTLPGDRRLLCTIGPFNFPAQKKLEFEYAYLFSRDTSLNNVKANLPLLQRDVRNVRYFSEQQSAGQCMPVSYVGVREIGREVLNCWVYPNPFNSKVALNLDHNAHIATITVSDITGRVVYEDKITESYRKEVALDDLKTGIYFMKVTENEKTRVIKLLKD